MKENNSFLEQIKQKHELEIMQIEGVEGVGIGEQFGKEYIAVYVSKKTSELKKKVAQILDNAPYKIKVTGKFKAF